MCKYCKSTGKRGVRLFKYKCAHCEKENAKRTTEQSNTTMTMLLNIYENKKEN